MAPVKLAPLPVNGNDGEHMGGHNDAGGHTADPHTPTTEPEATHPEADVHATAHMSHISWGRAGPAISIKNGAAAEGHYDLVVVGSRSLVYHPEHVEERERHLFCTVYDDSSGTPLEIARTPWSRLTNPDWSHGVKFPHFARTVTKRVPILVWSIHHDENDQQKTTCLVVGYGEVEPALLIQTQPMIAWIPLTMPPRGFTVKRPIVTDVNSGFVGGKFGGADGTHLPESLSDRLGPRDQLGMPGMVPEENKLPSLPTLAAAAQQRPSHAHIQDSAADAEDRTSLILAIYGVMVIAAYFGVVCAFYIPVEGWTVRECLYFAVVTFTTVGYGDYVPSGDGAKLFTCLVALCGVSFIAVGVGVIGQEVIKMQQKLVEKGKEAAAHAVHSQFTDETDEDGHKAITHVIEHIHASPPHAAKVIFYAFLPVVTVIGIHAIVVGHVEKWSVVDAIYISTITGTSVGYGELYPKEPFSQWFSVFSIPIMVFCISYALGKVAQIPVQHEMNKLHKKMLSIEITEDDFDLMGNGDGDIDRTEFIVHMLKAMKKVDDALIDKLMDRFNKLDADGSGFIDRDELKSVWQAKKEKVEGTAEGEARNKLGKHILKHKVALTSMAGKSGDLPAVSSKVRPVQTDLSDVASTAQIASEVVHQAKRNNSINNPGKHVDRYALHNPPGRPRPAGPKRGNSAAAFSPMGSFGAAGM